MEAELYKFRDMIIKSSSEGVTMESLNRMFEDLRRENEEMLALLE